MHFLGYCNNNTTLMLSCTGFCVIANQRSSVRSKTAKYNPSTRDCWPFHWNIHTCEAGCLVCAALIAEGAGWRGPSDLWKDQRRTNAKTALMSLSIWLVVMSPICFSLLKSPTWIPAYTKVTCYQAEFFLSKIPFLRVWLKDCAQAKKIASSVVHSISFKKSKL